MSSQSPVTRGQRSTRVTDLGNPLTTKAGSLVVLCTADGDIDGQANEGHGLYFHDMRYLSRATVRLEGRRLTTLLSTDYQNERSVCELANPDLVLRDGSHVPKHCLGIRRERALSDAIRETFSIQNFTDRALTVRLELAYGADFEDMFKIRGQEPSKRGEMHSPAWNEATLTLRYDGADSRRRTTVLTFDPLPDHRGAGGKATYDLRLEAGGSTHVEIRGEMADEGAGPIEQRPVVGRGHRTLDICSVETDNKLFDAVLARSFADLRMLLTRERGETFFAAGVPWYVALFGRDSLITAIEILTFDSRVAATTLELLARYQGKRDDPWRDEEPGKILHELRVGEMANVGDVPHTPYYGSVESTMLFVSLLADYVRWSGDLALWRRLRGHAARALEWIDRCGDHDQDGFVDYTRKADRGLVNQGWKDSYNAIAHPDGRLAEAPIALVEVQGCVYQAWLSAAWLYRLDGDQERAIELEAKAADLRQRFAKAYWLPHQRYLALALEQGGRQVPTITSNPGQALWTGIVEPEHAVAVASRLGGRQLFNGWGIRTLAEGQACYNPFDYQVGAVWPHDNALIAAGLKRYGFVDQALQVFTSLFDAAVHFDNYRLPELFAGFPRSQYPVPVRYPVACNPQAWAAGAIPFLLTTCLGLEADATQGKLRIRQPALPPWLSEVRLCDLHVGDTTVELHFQRRQDQVHVETVSRSGGELEIEVI